MRLEKSKTLLALLLAFAIAAPANAIPVVLQRQAYEFVDAYVRASVRNDIKAYADLFAPGAQITWGTASAVDKATWIASESERFSPRRGIRFPSIIADGERDNFRVIAIVEVSVCTPGVPECLPVFYSETLTVKDWKIIRMEISETLRTNLTPREAQGAR